MTIITIETSVSYLNTFTCYCSSFFVSYYLLLLWVLFLFIHFDVRHSTLVYFFMFTDNTSYLSRVSQQYRTQMIYIHHRWCSHWNTLIRHCSVPQITREISLLAGRKNAFTFFQENQLQDFGWFYVLFIVPSKSYKAFLVQLKF